MFYTVGICARNMNGDELLAITALYKLFAPEHLVRPSLLRGGLPSTGSAYGTAIETAWPSASETFLIALMSMADTVMVGGVGPRAIASVGLATQPRFLSLALILALNISVTAICARRRGENDREGAVRCLKQALLISVIMSVLTSVTVLQFSRGLLTFAGALPDTIEEAKIYFDIILLGLPINAVQLTINAAQRGIGRTRVSMYVNMLANVVNLVFNYLLIGGRLGFPRMGVKGAAVATVIGMFCGMITAIISVAGRGGFLSVFSRGGWGFDKQTLLTMYRVASGSFVEQACMRIGFFSFAVIIAKLGTLMFAAHNILMNVLSLSFSLGEGYCIAATTLVGQNLGAKRPDLSILYGKVCQRMSLVTCVGIFFIFIFGGKSIIAVFTNDPVIIQTCEPILLIMGVIVFAQSSQMIMMGALRGAGDTRFTAVVSLVSIVIIRPVLALVFAYVCGWGLVGAWLAFVADQYVRMIMTMRRFSSGKWMDIKI